MNFRLASTFNDSLLKLTGDEQKAVNAKALIANIAIIA
jgi:hypothetical protein